MCAPLSRDLVHNQTLKHVKPLLRIQILSVIIVDTINIVPFFAYFVNKIYFKLLHKLLFYCAIIPLVPVKKFLLCG